MKKNLWALGLVVLLAAALIFGMKIRSVKDGNSAHSDDVRSGSAAVTLSIRCDTVLKNWSRLDSSLQTGSYIPKNGVILKKTRLALRSGDTVYTVLDRAVRACRIQMEVQKAGQNQLGSVYVQGIHNLYEFSCGPLSGWIYSVNGKFSNVGCNRYRLKNGDAVEWVYTCDLGRDVGGGVGSRQTG